MLIVIGLFFLNNLSIAQEWDSLSVMAAKWSDSFVEWEFYSDVEDDEVAGTLEMRWKMNNDWTSWDFRLGERIGDVSAQWPDRYEEWQLNSEGQKVTMKTRWPGDFSEWRITDSDKSYILSVQNGSRPEEWQVKYEDDLTFQIYTEFEGDIRSWLVYQSGRKLPDATQIAMAFCVMVTVSPKI